MRAKILLIQFYTLLLSCGALERQTHQQQQHTGNTVIKKCKIIVHIT